jgi:hypothetical protein
MNQETKSEESVNNGSLSRKKFLLVSGLAAAGTGLGILNLSGVATTGRPVADAAERPGASRSGQPLIVGTANEPSSGDETALVGSVDSGQTLRLVNNSLSSRSRALLVDIEGDEYQRSGIWIRSKATKVDTVVGLFVENVGFGDGVYVENTSMSNGASGVAIVNRSNSIGLNGLHDSGGTFFQVLKNPQRNDAFGDLLAFKDLGLTDRIDSRALFIGGDCRLRTRVGIGNAEGIQMKRNESVKSGLSSLSVTLPVSEPDDNYGVVATPFWNTTVYVSDKTQTTFVLNFGTVSPGSELSWIVFRDTL